MSNIFVTGGSTGTGFATAVLCAKNKRAFFAIMRNASNKSGLLDTAYKKDLP